MVTVVSSLVAIDAQAELSDSNSERAKMAKIVDEVLFPACIQHVQRQCMHGVFSCAHELGIPFYSGSHFAWNLSYGFFLILFARLVQGKQSKTLRLS